MFDRKLPAANLATVITIYTTHSSLERAPMGHDPVRVRHELSELIQKQINAIEKETFGGATDVERREYEERRTRIYELYDELQRFNTAA